MLSRLLSKLPTDELLLLFAVAEAVLSAAVEQDPLTKTQPNQKPPSIHNPYPQPTPSTRA